MKKHKIFPFVLAAILTGAGACKKTEEAGLPNVNYDAVYVVNGESNTISVIDLNRDAVGHTFRLGEPSAGGHGGHGGNTATISWPHHVALHPSKAQLAIGVPGMDLSGGHGSTTAGMAGKVALVDAWTGAVQQTLTLPAMNHNAIFSPDGKELWTSQMAEPGNVLVYDAATLGLKNTIAAGNEPAEITFSADGKVAFAANVKDNTVTAIDPQSKQVKATIPAGEDPVGAWPGSDNRMYVDNEHGKSITVINAATLQVEETVPLGFTPAYAAYREGTPPELWVSDPDNGKVHYFHHMNGAWMNHGSIATGAGAHAIVFSRDFRKAYITNQMAGTVSVLNVQEKRKLKDIPVGQKPNGILIRYR